MVRDGSNLGSVLLKLRVLAARLGSKVLEEWVRHETEGYPRDSQVPSYRIIGVTYRGTFSGPFGSGIRNARIPSYLIEKYAGSIWTNHEMRDSIAAIDELVKRTVEGKETLRLDAANLILLLQGKVYEGYACNDIHGIISRASLAELQYAVRSRILDFTLELEKSVPAATDISFGNPGLSEDLNSDKVTQIYQQTIYGNVTTISSSGKGSHVFLSAGERDGKTMIEYLVKAGISESDASKFAEIVASEDPDSHEEPFGNKAKAWLVANIKKAADGTWKIGLSTATKALTEAVLRYYGLK